MSVCTVRSVCENERRTRHKKVANKDVTLFVCALAMSEGISDTNSHAVLAIKVSGKWTDVNRQVNTHFFMALTLVNENVV